MQVRGDGLVDVVLLCDECVGEGEVRTYCRRCGKRLALSEADAAELMKLLGVGLSIPPGSVIVYLKYCPLCQKSGEADAYPQRVYTIS